MKRLVFLPVAVAAAAALAAAGSAAPVRSATVTIRHQVHGCHAWAVGHGAFHASQVVHVARGGTLTFVDDDVMPQQLVEKSGAHARIVGNPSMNRMGASVQVVFSKPGTYEFTTKPGEDYKGVDAKTVGEDNVLTLEVVVS